MTNRHNVILRYRWTSDGCQALALDTDGRIRGSALRDTPRAAGRAARAEALAHPCDEPQYDSLYASDPWTYVPLGRL